MTIAPSELMCTKGTGGFQCNTMNLASAIPDDPCLPLSGSPRNLHISDTGFNINKETLTKKKVLSSEPSSQESCFSYVKVDQRNNSRATIEGKFTFAGWQMI